MLREVNMKSARRFFAVLAMITAFAAFGATVSALADEAENTSGWKILIDTTYLKQAVVSEEPITLGAEIRNKDNYRIYGKEISFSITSGTDKAELNGNELTVKAAGTFTVKATYENVTAEYQATAYEMTFSNIAFVTKFENITVYTPPIRMQCSVDVKSPVIPGEQHYKYVYTVLSGNAEIFSGEYLRITGTGKVVVEIASAYNRSVKTTAEFTVTDPDEGKVADDMQDALANAEAVGGGCSSGVSAGIFAGAALLAAGAIAIKRRRG